MDSLKVEFLNKEVWILSFGGAFQRANVYKKNIDDMRESPAVRIMELLQLRGAKISYSDPYVPEFPKMRNYNFKLTSEDINIDSIAEYDCIVVATNHDAFDWELIKQNAQLIVDTRGVYLEPAKNVVKA